MTGDIGEALESNFGSSVLPSAVPSTCAQPTYSKFLKPVDNSRQKSFSVTMDPDCSDIPIYRQIQPLLPTATTKSPSHLVPRNFSQRPASGLPAPHPRNPAPASHPLPPRPSPTLHPPRLRPLQMSLRDPTLVVRSGLSATRRGRAIRSSNPDLVRGIDLFAPRGRLPGPRGVFAAAAFLLREERGNPGAVDEIDSPREEGEEEEVEEYAVEKELGC